MHGRVRKVELDGRTSTFAYSNGCRQTPEKYDSMRGGGGEEIEAIGMP